MLIDEADLPSDLTPFAAVEAAYPAALSASHSALKRGLSVRIECDKELVPYLYRALRDRLKADGTSCVYLDGRPNPDDPPSQMPQGVMGTTISQLRDVVRGSVGERVVVLPHLDLLTTSTGGLTSEAREVIPLLYENPELLCIGFKDPSFELPKVIENLFAHQESLIGIARDRIRFLVTQREARKFGRGLNPYQLYKHLSGTNAVRMRRLLSTLETEDYPEDPRRALDELRAGTLTGELSVPEIGLEDDIGGYQKVKDRLKNEIMEILATKDAQTSDEAVKGIEELIPRGMIFWGPPGTGKTLFAKAIATSLGAAVQVISGPELKSKWVGESEHNLRQIFLKARQSAPSLIIFDELDSFASARGMYHSTGVEHSMVNQLLTEMDGFRKEELVFVVGTTNFVEALDPALLRPGRFEFHIHVPFPDADDRRAIFAIYNKRYSLEMDDAAIDYAVRRTRSIVEGTNSRYTGDHIQALCRAVARRRLRKLAKEGAKGGPTLAADIDAALVEYQDRPELTKAEELVVATHESGHAIVALHCPHSPPIDQISIRGDLSGALGYVRHGEKANRYVTTEKELHDHIAVLYGGREAERLLLDDLSIGASQDIDHATRIARALVAEFGFGDETVGSENFVQDRREAFDLQIAESTRAAIDANVRHLLERERQRAQNILEAERDSLIALRDLLLEKKVLDRKALGQFGASDGDDPAPASESGGSDAPADPQPQASGA